MNSNPKFRRPLNPVQFQTLQLLFKFRFVTAPLLTQVFGNKTRESTYQTLRILEDQGYIAKRYDKSYKLLGKQATYFLLPIAIKLLCDKFAYNDQVSNTMTRNRRASDGFINHNLDVLKAYITLAKNYPDEFHTFTAYELADFTYFPKPTSDLYLNRTKPKEGQGNEYLLDITGDKPLYAIKKRLDTYIEHYDSGAWEENEYPTILVACPNARIETSLQQYIAHKLESLGIDELKIYTTSTKALLDTASPEKEIWSNVFSPENLQSLD